jgi:hypothetical protein
MLTIVIHLERVLGCCIWYGRRSRQLWGCIIVRIVQWIPVTLSHDYRSDLKDQADLVWDSTHSVDYICTAPYHLKRPRH